MDSQVLGSNWIRFLAALAYAALATTLLIWVLPRTAATAPAVLILLGLPLAFRLVPRNTLYGMRSPRTLWTTEETWYRQNLITGVAMIAIGVIWIVVIGVRAVLE
jgi:hypothetical protein